MTVIKEVRVVMPFNLEDFKRGQLYSVPRSSREASSATDGIELVKKESYKSEITGKEGVYTEKIYHLENYVPGFLKAILPSSALKLEEKAWDAYPHCKTVLTNPFLGEEKFQFIIETMHKEFDPNDASEFPNGSSDSNEKESKSSGGWFSSKKKPAKETKTRHSELPYLENALNLSEEDLKHRDIHYMDISVDQITDKKGMKEGEEPNQFEGKKSGLGPLQKDWQFDNYKKQVNGEPCYPMMCAYKLVTIKCKVFGIGSKVESYLWATEIEIFLKFHKQMFCWSDDWWDLTREQIEEHDKKMFSETSNLLSSPENKKEPKNEAEDAEKLEKLSNLKLEEEATPSVA